MAVRYGITIHIILYASKKFWRILIWRLLKQTTKPPNLIPRQIFRLYGILPLHHHANMIHGHSVLAEFTESPTDLNVTEGDPLTLNCTFTNAERIFWRKDGMEIVSGDANFQIIDSVSAADTSALSLNPSSEHTVHTGVYDCVAVMSGREFSTTFTITVQCKYVSMQWNASVYVYA